MKRSVYETIIFFYYALTLAQRKWPELEVPPVSKRGGRVIHISFDGQRRIETRGASGSVGA